ncbi:MAG: RNA-binding transcriptional accessory protein [Oscillospiraceae bacterium]|nr:RNA-binding transcriptional accessory protein [Oscillospiraceae bacterium]
MDIIRQLQEEFKIRRDFAQNIVSLIDEGNTIPFIARYRKETHGSQDDQVLREFSERLAYLRSLEKRKEEVSGFIAAQDKLTDEITQSLTSAKTLAEVEDIYRPFKPKRKTRASAAREKGLEPLSVKIFAQLDGFDPLKVAAQFIDPEKGLETAGDALQGALDIIAEDVSDNAELRKTLRAFYLDKSAVLSRAAREGEDSVYRIYYDFAEPVKKIAGHRVLAIDRGEREGFLKVSVEADEEKALAHVYAPFLRKGADNPCREAVRTACADAYGRLIAPSMEREMRSYLTENAAENAIKVFAENLRQLLMQPPIKDRVTLGLDPGFRTGCKLAVVDRTGRVLDTGVIYNTPPNNKIAEAKRIVSGLIKKHKVDVISIGNGTASRESEAFVAELLTETGADTAYIIVNEAGASVYSASKLAAEEFPDYDVSIRSAVSIARRLQDPLAELVKIDPKSIGVGQYQHDMPKKRLDEALGSVVEDCVNSVGVDLNTASAPLFSFVSGINGGVAKNIVAYREENGAFSSRQTLLKVPKLGKKAFEQCAGFLRVPESENIFDNTGVHPEAYGAAEKLLELCGYSRGDVKNGEIGGIRDRIQKLGRSSIAEKAGIGLPTLEDIIKELLKPGRDPRDDLPRPLLRKDVLDISDLAEGMELTGTVRNVIDFGAFVDIGVHEDGLVHISQLSDKYVKRPGDVVKVGDIVKVKVLSVDAAKKRIALTMKGLNQRGI